ncbi:insulin-like growth factor-binding protein 1 [Pteronotus mesoamericanus]|uniref:insulin-like growth factor-binding protein 1 n=1 Tax=Pteronotus mesoamericanus TaxID=1884717 RepID=UPI0023EC71F0|nr:insulin-like growth factor-binding protein 1 [Pteronotus parnellii mesoamericanus]
MPAAPAALAWLLLLSVVQLGAAVGAPQPWHCAPCSAERLALCPPLPASCPEPARPAGCGCCPMCALPLGAACGVATARCAGGLSCRALPGEPRPLQALTRGRGACMPESDSAEATDVGGPVAPETVSPDDPGAAEMPLEQLPGTLRPALPSSEDLPVPWGALSDHEDTGVLGGTGVQERKGPCRRELHRVLGRLARGQQEAGDGPYRFYLPNCSKNGFYHSKQCETSLDGEAGLCWCVDPWSGRRIPGSVEVRGDPNCQQYFH